MTNYIMLICIFVKYELIKNIVIGTLAEENGCLISDKQPSVKLMLALFMLDCPKLQLGPFIGALWCNHVQWLGVKH